MSDPSAVQILSALVRHLEKLDPIWSKGLQAKPLEQQGFLNLVARVTSKEAEACCRIRRNDNSRQLSIYEKEIWATKQAIAHGIPAPRPLSAPFIFQVPEDGVEFVAYLSELMPGKTASQMIVDYPDTRSLILERIGEVAEKINSISTSGFGATFDNGRFVSSIMEHLASDMNRYGVQEMLGSKYQAGFELFQEELQSLETKIEGSHLAHADLNFSNMLLDPKTRKIIAVLDWERACSSLTPEFELMQTIFQYTILENRYTADQLRRTLHEQGMIEELKLFLHGYGISVDRYNTAHSHAVEVLLFSKVFPFLNWWLEEGSINAPQWGAAAERADVLVGTSSFRGATS